MLQDRLRRILGDLTFAEAYQRSGAGIRLFVSMGSGAAGDRQVSACSRSNPACSLLPVSRLAKRIAAV